MSTDHELPEPDASASKASIAPMSMGNAARRRLLKGGLGAAPVVLTVANRPVMAATGACSTASAFGSINASRPRNVTSCGGCKPAYWSNAAYYSSWPAGYVAVATGLTPATTFDSIFGSVGGYPGKTLLQVLQTTTTGRDAVARHCAAAVLNNAKNLTPSPVLSIQTAKNVWSDFVARGYYEPTAGIRWYAESSTPAGSGSIVQWLVSTMPN